MKNMLHIDLFSGIGGFSLAADAVWDDMEHIFVENDLFCRAILKKHWPNSEIHGDIKLFTYSERERYERGESETGQTTRRGRRPFILTGGFPCQPFSQAGRRQGTSDNRYLWPEMFAVIRDTAPEWVIAENVRGLITWNDGMVLETVCADLESEGYEVWPLLIPACAVGAPHRRDRIWILAHGGADTDVENTRSERRRRGSEGNRQILESKIPKAQNERPDWPDWSRDWREVAFATCDDSVDDELSSRLARPKGWRNAALKACGNAIVPAVAIEIMKAIAYAKT